MGEVAEMMLDGTLCAGCGVYLHGDGEGIPRHCEDCCDPVMPIMSRPKVSCPICKKRVKAAGLEDHKRDAHGMKGQS